jgi:hypothetical protein
LQIFQNYPIKYKVNYIFKRPGEIFGLAVRLTKYNFQCDYLWLIPELVGKFCCRISDNGENRSNSVDCYVSDSSDSNSSILFLSDEFGEAIINGDEIFGMIGGGEFACYDMDVEVECVINVASQGLIRNGSG